MFLLHVEYVRSNDECGLVNDTNGGPTELVPWQAAFVGDFSYPTLQCLGSIINKRTIISARNCFIPLGSETQQKQRFRIVLGNYSVPNGVHPSESDSYRIAEFKPPLHIDPPPYDTGNIQLIIVDRDIEFVLNRIAAICLPPNDAAANADWDIATEVAIMALYRYKQSSRGPVNLLNAFEGIIDSEPDCLRALDEPIDALPEKTDVWCVRHVYDLVRDGQEMRDLGSGMAVKQSLGDGPAKYYLYGVANGVDLRFGSVKLYRKITTYLNQINELIKE